jgi:two-component system cell cycle sensor histidine kinase PleC
VKSAPVAEEETAAVQVAVAPEPLPSILDEIKPVEETANIVLLPDDNKLAEALRRTEAELRIAQNGRSAFLSAMSHELRTPLNAIMGFAEMIKNGVHGPLGNEVYQNYVQHIHDSGGELLSKVNDLLTIGSMNAHEFELDESDFLLSELLAEAIAVHSHAAFSRRLQMRLDAPSGIEVHGDRTQLLCALAHFLSNAINHSENGKEILMTARIQPDEGLILSVRDQGEGIAPQQVQHIREALQQEASYLAVQGGGIGLGLSLANELANRHGGRIMIDSIRHRGTVVSLIIPKQRILRGMPVKRRGSGVRG